MISQGTDFHRTIADYYDEDVHLGFEARAEANPILNRIREDFRRISVRYPFHNVLEIGCGPGLDVVWFASEFPDSSVTGIDISPAMVRAAEQRIHQAKLQNALVLVTDERGLSGHFKKDQFDMVYVYFGALNTVADLGIAAQEIYNVIKSGGHAVLTFVNKWYYREMLVQSLKLNFKTAFARLRKEWGGYSPDRHLPSRCYSPREIIKAFRQFELLEKRGYSILFPAWYNYKKAMANPQLTYKLWKADLRLQNTCFWSKGEYTLFVFRKD